MIETKYPAQAESVWTGTLPDGLRIQVVKKTGFRQCHAMFAARYGGADRRFSLAGEWIDTPAGVAHFLEHKMFDMPDGRDVLAELSARGANPNAFTGAGVTAYHFTCTEDFYTNLETLLTYVSTPWYTPESVAKEQGIIGQEIRMYENSPGTEAYYELMKALYARHPIRDTVAGTVESIAEITPEILYHCHKVFYNPSNMALVCVGDVDPERVAATAERILPKEPGEVPQRDYGPDEGLLPAEARREKAMTVAQPIFMIGGKLPAPERGRDRLRYRLLGELALECLIGDSSELFNDLYARGLLSRNFDHELDDAAGTMTAVLAGESRAPEQVLEALYAGVNKVAGKGLSETGFERCRRSRYGAELSALDQFGGAAYQRVQGCFGGWDPMDVFPLLEELDREEAAAFLCENFTPERLAMAAVRPAD